MYSNGSVNASGNASVAADARCGLPLNGRNFTWVVLNTCML